MCRSSLSGLLVTALALGLLGTTGADAQAVRGTILGTVADSSGGALPGATVEVRNVATGVAQTLVTNEQGRFNAPDLNPGDYEVSATLQGFQTVVQRGISLAVGQQRVLDFQLGVGTLQESITVQGSAAQVDIVSSALGTRVEQKQISDLPLNGRNFSQLLTLAPGVEQTANPSSRLGRQPGYSVSGSRPDGQAFLLDNTNIQNFWNRGSGSGVLGTTLGVEAVGEFQTLTNTYSAQFGGAGGVVNAITKSGANAIRGSVYEYVRNDRFDGRNFFDLTKPEFKRHQFGASVGGPIRRDRAFFFFNYEGINIKEGVTRVAFVPDDNARLGLIPIGGQLTSVPIHAAIRPLLDLFPRATALRGNGVGTVSQVATNAGSEHYVLARVDYNFSDRDSIFGRYVSDSASLFEPFAGSNIPLWPAENSTNNDFLTIEQRRILKASLVNQVRVSYTKTFEDALNVGGTPELQFFPREVVPTNGNVNPGGGMSVIGHQTLNPFNLEQRRYTVADDVSWLTGSHSIRVGGHVERWMTDLDLPFQSGGLWTFTSLQTFLTNQPQLLQGALPGSSAARKFRSTHFVGYIHDDWTVGDDLTLNLGVRYEPTTLATVTSVVGGREVPAQTVVDGVNSTGFTEVDRVFRDNPSLKNIDPRIGFAWQPFDNQRTSVRGGFGTFHNPIVPRNYATGYYLNPPFFGARQDFPTYPTPFTGTSPTLLSQTNGMDFDSAGTPYYMQWNVNVQREVMDATILTVGYVGSAGRKLQMGRDINPPRASTAPDGTTVYGVPRGATPGIIPNPRLHLTLGSLNSMNTIAESKYHSFQAGLNRRFYRNLQSQLTYTLARCRDHASGQFGLDGGAPAINPYDIELDWGPCSFSRTHSFRASGVYALPFTGNVLVEGWQLGGILSVLSGQRFTPQIGFDQAGVTTNQQRPSWAQGRDPKNAILGRVDRYFDPEAFVLPRAGTFGDVGRNVLTGPDFINLDFSVIKDTRMPAISDNFSLQFRIESFNLLNRANFNLPTINTFAQAANGGGTISPAAGTIITAQPGRQLQFAVKVLF